MALEKFPNTIQESKPVEGHENDPKAVEAAKLINEFTQKVFHVLQETKVNKRRVSEGKMPGNAIVSRDAGDCLPKFPSFTKANGLRFGSFVQMPVEKGIALLTGIDVVNLPLSTGNSEIDYPLWAETAVKKSKDFDGLYIHIKGPDEPAHDGNFNKKKASIEEIDKFFFGSLLPKIDLNDFIIAITADHSTPCKLKSHSADPVPLLAVGGNIKPDGSLSFSEKTAKLGSIGELTGQEILPFLVQHAKK